MTPKNYFSIYQLTIYRASVKQKISLGNSEYPMGTEIFIKTIIYRSLKSGYIILFGNPLRQIRMPSSTPLQVS